jgi:hypothetical protein
VEEHSQQCAHLKKNARGAGRVSKMAHSLLCAGRERGGALGLSCSSIVSELYETSLASEQAHAGSHLAVGEEPPSLPWRLDNHPGDEAKGDLAMASMAARRVVIFQMQRANDQGGAHARHPPTSVTISHTKPHGVDADGEHAAGVGVAGRALT